MTLQDFFNPVLCGSLILSGRPFNFEAILSRAKKNNFKLLSKTDQQAPTITVLTSLREIWSVKLTKKNPLIQNLNTCILRQVKDADISCEI